MSCPEEQNLFLYREGSDEISEEQADEISAHIGQCPECQAKLAEFDALAAALKQPLPVSESFRNQFVSDIVLNLDKEHKAEKTAPSFGFWSTKIPMIAAVSCGLFAIIALSGLAFFGTLSRDAEQGEIAAASPGSYEPARSQFLGRDGARELPSPGNTITKTLNGRDEVNRQLKNLGYRGPDEEGGFRGGRSTGPGGKGRPSATAPEPALSAVPTESAPMSPRRQLEESGGTIAAQSQGTERDSSINNGIALRQGQGVEAPLPGYSPPSPQANAPLVLNSTPSGAIVNLPRSRKAPPVGWNQNQINLRNAPAANQPTAIDPNGRFATTYRPGRGHLARFEKAMLKGIVPESALGIVSEEAQGHGPVIQAPEQKALAFDIRPGMTKISPDGGPVHLAITLRSSEQQPRGRPPIAVHIVMDTSGSMNGQPIEHARQAAQKLVQLLRPGDRFSLVQYSSNASVVIPDGEVATRRARIEQQINSLVASGGTNLEAGLRLGYEQADISQRIFSRRRSALDRDSHIQLVIVLSDGRPNQGITNPRMLSEMSATAFQNGVETTSIGVGTNYEPRVMSEIAEYGSGGYYYLPDSATIESVLQTELDIRSQPVARGVEIRVNLADGVELLQAYGSRRLNEMESQRVRRTEVAIDQQEAQRNDITQDRQEDREGGMRFFIPGFARNDSHTILLRLRAPSGTGDLSLASVEFRYKDRLTNRNEGDEREVRVTYAQNTAEAMGSQDREVRRAVYGFRTGQVLHNVSGMLSRRDNTGAQQLLFEQRELLLRAADELNDSMLRRDAHRLEGFRQSISGGMMTDQLMVSSMLERAGNGFMR